MACRTIKVKHIFEKKIVVTPRFLIKYAFLSIISSGASIIRMMAHFLGDDKLKSGLSSYLNHFSYGNAKQKDLWDHLSKDGYAYDKDKIVQLNTIMDTWTRQAGYPVITVTRDYAMKTADIRQVLHIINK